MLLILSAALLGVWFTRHRRRGKAMEPKDCTNATDPDGNQRSALTLNPTLPHAAALQPTSAHDIVPEFTPVYVTTEFAPVYVMAEAEMRGAALAIRLTRRRLRLRARPPLPHRPRLSARRPAHAAAWKHSSNIKRTRTPRWARVKAVTLWPSQPGSTSSWMRPSNPFRCPAHTAAWEPPSNDNRTRTTRLARIMAVVRKCRLSSTATTPPSPAVMCTSCPMAARISRRRSTRLWMRAVAAALVIRSTHIKTWVTPAASRATTECTWCLAWQAIGSGCRWSV